MFLLIDDELLKPKISKQSWTKAKQVRALSMILDLGYAALGADSEEYAALTKVILKNNRKINEISG